MESIHPMKESTIKSTCSVKQSSKSDLLEMATSIWPSCISYIIMSTLSCHAYEGFKCTLLSKFRVIPRSTFGHALLKLFSSACPNIELGITTTATMTLKSHISLGLITYTSPLTTITFCQVCPNPMAVPKLILLHLKRRP